MMTHLVPPIDSVAHRAIEGILQTLSEEGRPQPPYILVDDGSGDWRRQAASFPLEERRRSVFAALSAVSLFDAVRYEIGGASWLPASTPSMEAACETAAAGSRLGVVPFATRGVIETVIEGAGELFAVGWWPTSFWHRQVGARRLFTGLTAIAAGLRCVPVILPGPVLVVAGCDSNAIEAVCRDSSTAQTGGFLIPPAVVKLAKGQGSDGSGSRVEDLLPSVGSLGRQEGPQFDPPVLPVLNMPSGRRVGWWGLSRESQSGGSGWLASPTDLDHSVDAWEIVEDDGKATTVVETKFHFDQEGTGQMVIRIPGLLGAEVRGGSPAGLLVERWAEHPARAGRPLWVPSVDAEGVQFLLGLPGPIWVDGPGVPR